MKKIIILLWQGESVISNFTLSHSIDYTLTKELWLPILGRTHTQIKPALFRNLNTTDEEN